MTKKITQKELRHMYEVFHQFRERVYGLDETSKILGEIDTIFYYIACNPRLIKVFEKFVSWYDVFKNNKKISQPIARSLYSTFSYFDVNEPKKKK